MQSVPDLGQVLIDAREEAALLRRRGYTQHAESIDELVTRVQESAEEWLLWLSEGDAMVRTGFSQAWLRARFEAWQRDGHARLVGRARQYRACVLPRRANLAGAAARGREAAREAKGEHQHT